MYKISVFLADMAVSL